MNRKAKKIYKQLEYMLGDFVAGLILAIICDLFCEIVKGKDMIEMRSIEIKINDFFSAKHDFTKDRYLK